MINLEGAVHFFQTSPVGCEGIEGFNLVYDLLNVWDAEDLNACGEHDATAYERGSEGIVEPSDANGLFRLWIFRWRVCEGVHGNGV